eukprot:TRINITY_DN54941_c0_g1_i1.p1 TRINITY_DN54941_c0_g1~~TRINITY_DN54941_c0_g1_i1.p1  ORF type:complete len:224 (+),score=35.90 TRINITY_DN54941_c0_g1_i1:71-673(+)
MAVADAKMQTGSAQLAVDASVKVTRNAASSLPSAKAMVGIAFVAGGVAVATAVAIRRNQRRKASPIVQLAPPPAPTHSEASAPAPVPATTGCSRNAGPMAEWQSKLHAANLVVGETLLALRGGSMKVRNELKQIQELLSSAEVTASDSVYCTKHEADLARMMKSLDVLLESDASSSLLHPLKGETVRQNIVSALEALDGN